MYFCFQAHGRLDLIGGGYGYFSPESLLCKYQQAGPQGDTWDTYSDWYYNTGKRRVGDIIVYLGCGQQPDCGNIGHSGLGHFAIYAGVLDGSAKRVDSLPDGGAAVRSLHTPDSCAIKGQPYAVLHPNYDRPCTGSLRICKHLNQNGTFEATRWPFKILETDQVFYTDVDTGCSQDIQLNEGTYTIAEWDDINSRVITADTDGYFTYNNQRYRVADPDVALPGPVQKSVHITCDQTTPVTLSFRNVCLGKVTVRKFRDLDMDGNRSTADPNETYLPGWSVQLIPVVNGVDGTPIPGVTSTDTNAVTFPDLDPGTYKVTEVGPWDEIERSCDGVSYCDWQTVRDGQRWQFTGATLEGSRVLYARETDLCNTSPPPTVSAVQVTCDHNTIVEFGNVCLTPVQACKSEDRDMDGNPDPGGAMDDWPFTVNGTRADGRPICPMTKSTGTNGCAIFDQPNELLPPGQYTVAEVDKDPAAGSQWTEDPTICQGQVLYTDWRTTWDGERWQSTKPRPEDSCRWLNGQKVKNTSPSYCFEIDGTTCGTTAEFDFTNVCLGEMSAFKFHDKNMNGLYEPNGEPFTDANGNGVWDPAEPFTDLTPGCDGTWNEGEYKRDLNGNGVWDPAEPFVDLDGDKLWDEPECPIEGWPFRLFGTRADGRPLCIGDGPNLVKTNSFGKAVFKDVPPPPLDRPNGYTLTERFDIGHCANNPNPGWQPEITWNKYQLGPNWFAWRTTYGPIHPICPPNGCDVTRWESCPAAADGGDRPASLEKSPLYVYCDPTPTENFGNVCLTTVDGDKLVYDDGVPGVGTPKPGAGWEICLAGKDLHGRDIVPSDANLNPITAVAAPPIDLPCKTPVWHSVLCDANGHFRFTDLPPGHYELMERVDCDYKLTMSQPMLSGFNLECCPEYVELQNFRKGLITNVYQVYPGDSNGQEQHNSGYDGLFGELISAVPGVLKIVPGPDWTNFKQGEQLCRETPIKNILLQKKFDGFSQCGDVFYPLTVSQQGRNNIRLWWPLMYEPPTTTWTLKIIYGTRTPVQFPGECIPGYVHEEVWKWTVDADIPHMRLFVDLLHETPYGLDEVPLISDEVLYPQLLSRLDAIQAAAETDTVSAGLLLGEFEMTVMDACIAASPARPTPTGPGTGIANSFENPACCKLLVDSEYVGKKLGIWQQVK